ncbi:MAG: DUF4870 domain-containing protein [Candidatus Omnitrophica bacterium]|nr:DUF4870 domain-containing protein [Candidatus Omnitrophota bacterium]
MSDQILNLKSANFNERSLGLLVHALPVSLLIIYFSVVLMTSFSFQWKVVFACVGVVLMIWVPLMIWLRTRKASLFLNGHGKEAVTYYVNMTLLFLATLWVALVSFLFMNSDSFYAGNASSSFLFSLVNLIFLASCHAVVILVLYIPVAAMFGGILALLGKDVQYPFVLRFMHWKQAKRIR